MNKLNITISTPDGELTRTYAYDQSPYELNLADITGDMLDTLAQSYEVEADIALNHNNN